MRGDAAGSQVPLLGARPLPVVATKSSHGSRREGRGQTVGTARPKSVEEGKPGRRRVGTGGKGSGLRSMQRDPTRAQPLAEIRRHRSLVAASRVASMAWRPAVRGG